jgi:hypothetical protein
MPVLNDKILNDNTMTPHTLPTGHYGYSGTRIEKLGAAEYTLVTVVTDVSGSVHAYRREMEDAIKEIVAACKHAPRADNLMLRLVTFADTLREAHGFKLLGNCNAADYDGILSPGGNTALYDATENAVAAATAYGKQLAAADYAANAILFVITDGQDNVSRGSAGKVRQAFEQTVATEALESLVSILVGVNAQSLGGYLMDYRRDAGFTQYVELDRADAATLAQLAKFVARSIFAQSQALGTGGPSRPLTF